LSCVWRVAGALSLREGGQGERDVALFVAGASAGEMQGGGVFCRTRWLLVTEVRDAEAGFGEVGGNHNRSLLILNY